MGNDDIYIENYRLISKLGSGAFGSVYKAQHAILTNRIVALKLMRPDHTENEEAIIRFLMESQILEKLKHPYILPIINAGIYNGLPYQVTEYASKGSLRDRLQRQPSRPLPIVEAITILSQIGQALQYAHDQNIIHRDLKPENILFNEKGEALVADFGIATILSTSSIKQTNTLGTYQYMAPEEYQDLICKESDQYALGCIAYELFTGYLPFQASNTATIIAKHLTEQPVTPRNYNPDLPEHFERAILKALAKQRIDRHADISAFITALITTPSGLSQVAKKEWMIKFIAMGRIPGQKEQLIAACKQAIRLDSNFADAYFCEGVALYDLKRYKEALVAFESFIRIEPNSSLAWFYMGDLLKHYGKHTEANNAYKKAKELHKIEFGEDNEDED